MVTDRLEQYIDTHDNLDAYNAGELEDSWLVSKEATTETWGLRLSRLRCFLLQTSWSRGTGIHYKLLAVTWFNREEG